MYIFVATDYAELSTKKEPIMLILRVSFILLRR